MMRRVSTGLYYVEVLPNVETSTSEVFCPRVHHSETLKTNDVSDVGRLLSYLDRPNRTKIAQRDIVPVTRDAKTPPTQRSYQLISSPVTEVSQAL